MLIALRTPGLCLLLMGSNRERALGNGLLPMWWALRPAFSERSGEEAAPLLLLYDATMSQKSSIPRSTHSVRQVLTATRSHHLELSRGNAFGTIITNRAHARVPMIRRGKPAHHILHWREMQA